MLGRSTALREEVLALFRTDTIDPAVVTSAHGAGPPRRWPR